MKHFKRTAVALALLGLAGNAAAAISEDLSVIGTIKSPACGVALDGGGVVDFKGISRTLLKPAETVGIGALDVKATVTCTDDTLVLLKVVDDMATDKPAGNMNVKFAGSTVPGADGAYANASLLGLGQSHTGTPIGGYVLAFGLPSIDGVKATYVMSNNTGAIDYGNYSASVLYYNQTSASHFGANNDGSMKANIAGKIHEFPMAVAVSLDKSGNIPGDQDISLDGKATLEVVYL